MNTELTEAQFRSDEKLSGELRKILHHSDALQEALRTLRGMDPARTCASRGAAADALLCNQSFGWNNSINALFRLSEPLNEETETEPQLPSEYDMEREMQELGDPDIGL